MKIEYLKINTDYLEDSLIRIYNFTEAEVKKFYLDIRGLVNGEQSVIDFSGLEFVESVNCNLKFIVGNDVGVIDELNDMNFVCELSIKGYKEVLNYVEPFLSDPSDLSGYQFIVDPISGIELLLSKGGGW